MGLDTIQCEYCGDGIETGIPSDEGTFCSYDCEQLELGDRLDAKAEGYIDGLTLQEQLEARTDFAIDLEREKLL